jgi:hypothetical protein
MKLCQSNLILSFDQLDIQNDINLSQIFHIKVLAHKGFDLFNHVKICIKNQYVINIQAQYNSLTPTMAIVHTSIRLID